MVKAKVLLMILRVKHTSTIWGWVCVHKCRIGC